MKLFLTFSLVLSAAAANATGIESLPLAVLPVTRSLVVTRDVTFNSFILGPETWHTDEVTGVRTLRQTNSLLFRDGKMLTDESGGTGKTCSIILKHHVPQFDPLPLVLSKGTILEISLNRGLNDLNSGVIKVQNHERITKIECTNQRGFFGKLFGSSIHKPTLGDFRRAFKGALEFEISESEEDALRLGDLAKKITNDLNYFCGVSLNEELLSFIQDQRITSKEAKVLAKKARNLTSNCSGNGPIAQLSFEQVKVLLKDLRNQ